MYSSSSGEFEEPFQPHSIPFSLPLDPDLQAASLHPLGTLQFNRPFGDLEYDKTRRTLGLPRGEVNDALKLTALGLLLESAKRPVKVPSMLDNGLFAELILNAAEDNEQVRVLSTAALAAITLPRAGREFALQADIVPRLAKLAATSEPSSAVRLNVLRAFLHMAGSQAGIAHLLARGLLDLLVAKVESEQDLACRAATLDILIDCLREPAGWRTALDAGIVPTVASVLRAMLYEASTVAATEAVVAAAGVVATNSKALFLVLAALAKTVAHVAAVKLEGKDACVQADVVSLLTSLLPHPVVPVRVAASLALQNLANSESGKRAALAAQAIVPLLEACGDSDEMVQCQSMQALTSLAEHPVAKADERVHKALDYLREMASGSPSAKVRHAAQLAIDQITWQP